MLGLLVPDFPEPDPELGAELDPELCGFALALGPADVERDAAP